MTVFFFTFFYFDYFRFKNLHFKDPVRCQRAIDILKQILILKENSENVASTEPHTNNLTANKPSDSFDLWSYHTSVATEQVQNKSSPMY